MIEKIMIKIYEKDTLTDEEIKVLNKRAELVAKKNANRKPTQNT